MILQELPGSLELIRDSGLKPEQFHSLWPVEEADSSPTLTQRAESKQLKLLLGYTSHGPPVAGYSLMESQKKKKKKSRFITNFVLKRYVFIIKSSKNSMLLLNFLHNKNKPLLENFVTFTYFMGHHY